MDKNIWELISSSKGGFVPSGVIDSYRSMMDPVCRMYRLLLISKTLMKQL